MTKSSKRPTALLWARFRFSVVGPLLASPPAPGELKRALGKLAETTWIHPVARREVRFSARTIECWYYKARSAGDDPLAALRRAVRKDAGTISLSALLADRLRAQYRAHGHWSYQLHHDNLVALAEEETTLGAVPSYTTLRRYMKAHAMPRKPRKRKQRPGEDSRQEPHERREVRSFEVEHVGALWHLDFHHGSLKVLTGDGRWQRPLLLSIIDDHSRLVGHMQWYLSETAEDLVHGLSQAMQKRGLPRALLTDNGSAMVAAEFEEGLSRLSVLHNTTLPYSPHQNAKQEVLFATVEGRLMAMLENVPDLSLEELNRVTQAWYELDHNRSTHAELGVAPIERYASAPEVLRASPSSQALREAFRVQARRRQRRSDGTISLDGVRFEIPSRFRHFVDVTVRYARWDLGFVDLVDERSDQLLARIYPLDRQANADGLRRALEEDSTDDSDEALQADHEEPDGHRYPPLLRQLLEEYSASGLPPAYLPRTPDREEGDRT